MSGGDGPYCLYLLVLPRAWSAARSSAMRMPMGKAFKMVLAWVAIFGLFHPLLLPRRIFWLWHTG